MLKRGTMAKEKWAETKVKVQQRQAAEHFAARECTHMLECVSFRRVCVSHSVASYVKAATEPWLCRAPGASPTTGSYCSTTPWFTYRYTCKHSVWQVDGMQPRHLAGWNVSWSVLQARPCSYFTNVGFIPRIRSLRTTALDTVLARI